MLLLSGQTHRLWFYDFFFAGRVRGVINIRLVTLELTEYMFGERNML